MIFQMIQAALLAAPAISPVAAGSAFGRGPTLHRRRRLSRLRRSGNDVGAPPEQALEGHPTGLGVARWQPRWKCWNPAMACDMAGDCASPGVSLQVAAITFCSLRVRTADGLPP